MISTNGPEIGNRNIAGKAYEIHNIETATLDPVFSKILEINMKLTRCMVICDKICELQSFKKLRFFPVVKNRNFLKLWRSQILSQMTIHLVNFMLISRIFEKTGSSVAVSMLWISYALPAIFLLPISGPLVDIMNRKRILLFTNILQAVTVLSFLVVNDHIYSVLPIVFIYSALNQFYIPAEAASIPDLVPKNFLPAANSLFLLTSQLMFVIGFGAGGSLISLLGHKIPFLLSSLMLTLAAVAVWTL